MAALGSSSDGARHYMLTTEERDRYFKFLDEQKNFEAYLEFQKANNGKKAPLDPEEQHKVDGIKIALLEKENEELKGRLEERVSAAPDCCPCFTRVKNVVKSVNPYYLVVGATLATAAAYVGMKWYFGVTRDEDCLVPNPTSTIFSEGIKHVRNETHVNTCNSIAPMPVSSKLSPYETGMAPNPPGVFTPGAAPRMAGFEGKLPTVGGGDPGPSSQAFYATFSGNPPVRFQNVSEMSIDRDGDGFSDRYSSSSNSDRGGSDHFESQRGLKDFASSTLNTGKDLVEAGALFRGGHPVLAGERCFSAAGHATEALTDLGNGASYVAGEVFVDTPLQRENLGNAGAVSFDK